jgi:probable FeS assembly SUF system protein SufT
MSDSGYIELTRDVAATQIPSGHAITLPQGTAVGITQSLGGTYTVHVAGEGGLFRIKGEDADALGHDQQEAHRMVEGPFEEEKVWEQLRTCYDPEIPVNIVDLGLIYSLEAVDDAHAPGKQVTVKMTLTAPGCGMGPVIAEDARQKIAALPTVESAKVHIVWDPQWNPQMISADGRKILGLE